MYISLNQLGSCVMEVEDDGKGGQNLIVKFIRENNEIDDYFTINKTGIVTPNVNENNSGQESKILTYIADSKLITIAVNEKERLKKVKFYNSIGELVSKSRRDIINVSKMAKGLYVVEVVTNKKTYTESVTIK